MELLLLMKIMSVYLLEEYLIISLSVLVNVAFLTLLERKVLSLAQTRVGPNKVGAWGVLQPAADAVKLFTKMISVLGPVNKGVFFLSPLGALFLSLMFLSLISSSPGGGLVFMGVMLLLMLLSLNVYPLMGAGWSSNSKYALLGSLRGIAQTIAYEISLSFLLMATVIVWGGINFENFLGGSVPPIIYQSVLCTFWAVTCIAELNRTPFDFAEGESELISGFNIEYGAVKFAMIFMAEYMMIYFLSALTVSLFVLPSQSKLWFVLFTISLAFGVIWLRGTLPRFRYDLLMSLTWKHLLPWVLGVCQLGGGMAVWGWS